MLEVEAPPRNRRRWILWLAVPGVLIVIGVMAFAIFEPIQVLPRIRLGPGYSLVDQAGAPFTSEDVRGAVVIYSFGHDECGDRCAGMESTVREVRSRLDEVDLGDVDVRFVTISLDPANEGPDELASQAARASADGDEWRYVSGDPAHVENVVRAGFRTWFEADGDGSVSFDPALILVDGWGVVRGEYRYQTVASDADKIIRHLDVLGEELRNATGAATVAYEAAHFFLCYP